MIAKDGASKINNGDVILTHARSHVVEMIIKQAADEKKEFRVIVVDSRPKLEGKELLKALVAHGVKCTYVLINAVANVMKEVLTARPPSRECMSSRRGRSQTWSFR